MGDISKEHQLVFRELLLYFYLIAQVIHVTDDAIAAVYEWFMGNMEDSEGKKEEYQIINPVKYQRFIYLSERAVQFSKISGCNIKIQTFPDMSALIKMQTGYIWLLSDGESALEDKETMKNLLNEADWVGIGSRKHGEKDVVELEFWFELAEKLKK